MQTLKDIFVPYEIAQKLKEIGFEEECIAYYDDRYRLYMWHHIMTRKVDVEEELSIGNFNESNPYHNIISAPTWEQVKKWFREKNYSYNTYKASDLTHFSEVYKNNNEYLGGTDFFKTYEEARETLIYKLIEIYENECKR